MEVSTKRRVGVHDELGQWKPYKSFSILYIRTQWAVNTLSVQEGDAL